MSARMSPLSTSDPRASDPLLEDLVAFVGYRPNALLTMARMPGLLNSVLALVQTAIRGEGQVAPELRFLVACEVSRGAGCAYSATHAVHAAFHLGVSWAKLAALDDWEHSDHFTAHERAALGIARSGATLPVAPADAAFAQAAKFFTAEQLLEIVAAVALFGWFNRWNSLVRSELEVVPAEALDHVPWLRRMTGSARSEGR